jgi:transposase
MADEVLAYVANYHPLLGHLMQQTGIIPLLSTLLDDDTQEYEVDAGTVVAGMIHNILSPEPIRLYRLTSFWQDKALPLFFPWQPTLLPEVINEDRCGRVLDALYGAGPQKVFSAIMRQVIRAYALDVSHVHYDTTSKSFSGVYAEQTAEQGPQIVRGYSKDHRPDLAQLLFGVVMSRDGVLVAGEVAAGNEQDMTANGYWITHIRQHLGLELQQLLLYVADSAAVTEENLRLCRLFHLDLLSRLPERFGLAETLFTQALAAAASWTTLGALSSELHAAQYQAWDTTAELADATYRFLVVRSDHLQAQQAETLTRAVAKELTTLQQALTKLASQRWDTAADAETARRAWDKAHPAHYYQITWTTESYTELAPRTRPGRPRRDEVRPTVELYRLQGAVTADPDRIAAARERCGLFVLITTLLDQEAYPPATLLAEYKEQHLAERMHSFLKDPLAVGAFCLKKPERVIALGSVLLIAAMVYTLLERQVRQALDTTEQLPIEGLDHRPTRRPTTWTIFTALKAILILAQRTGDTWRFAPARPLTANQQRILTLAGFSPDIYTWQGQLAPENLGLAAP